LDDIDVVLQAVAEENEAYVKAMLQLLEDVGANAPHLFAKQGPAVAKLCTSDDSAVAAMGARVLATAGRAIVESKAEGALDDPSHL
jgi:hypothetical protein